MKKILCAFIILSISCIPAVSKDDFFREEPSILQKAWQGLKTGAQRPFFTFPPELSMLLKQIKPNQTYSEIFHDLRKNGISRKTGGVFVHHINGMFLKSFYTYGLVATIPAATKRTWPELSYDYPFFPWTALAATIAIGDAATLPFFEENKVKYLNPHHEHKGLSHTLKRVARSYKKTGLITGQISFWNAMIFFKFNVLLQSYLKETRIDYPLTIPEQMLAATISSGLQALATVPLINERTLRLASSTEEKGFLFYTIRSLKHKRLLEAYKGGMSKWVQLFLIGWFNIYAVNALNK